MEGTERTRIGAGIVALPRIVFDNAPTEFATRLTLLCGGSFVAFIGTGAPVFLLALGIYMITVLGAYVAYSRSRNAPEGVWHKLFVVLELTCSATYVGFIAYFLLQEPMIFKIIGGAGVIAAILKGFTARSHFKIHALIERIAFTALLYLLAYAVAHHLTSFAEQLVTYTFTTGVAIYYWIVWIKIASIREELLHMAFQDENAKRIRDIGQIAGGVAHDFNNILTVIIGNLSLYHEEPDRKERDVLVRDSQKASERASVLVSQLMSFAGQSPHVQRDIDLRILLPDLLALHPISMRSDVQTAARVPDDLWLLRADEKQLANALTSLFTNANEAMPEGGELYLEAQNYQADPERDGLAPGKYIEISITDNGRGIPPNLINRVFDPFYTTKEIGQGSGLGLSMARGFAQQCGGSLELRSKPGVATTATLFLPIREPGT